MVAAYYREVFTRTIAKKWDALKYAGAIAGLLSFGGLALGLSTKGLIPILLVPGVLIYLLPVTAREMHDEHSAKISLLQSEVAYLTTKRFRATNMGRRGDGMYYLEIENLDKASSQAFTAKLVQAVDETGTIVAESWRLTGPDCLGGMFHVAAGRTVKVNFANKTGDIARLVAEANNVKLPRNDYKIKILIDNARVPTELNLRFDGTHFYLLEGPDNPAIGPF